MEVHRSISRSLAAMNRFHRWCCASPRWAGRIGDSLIPWVIGKSTLGDDVLEIGPGPGLTTNALVVRAERLTTIEVDPDLAASLQQRLPDVTTINADATEMPFDTGRFSAAVSFTMLHHVPSAELQDKLLGEVHRVLRPGGLFLGSDSTSSFLFRVAHWFDTMVVIDPETFAERLARAGFHDPAVTATPRAFRFRARA